MALAASILEHALVVESRLHSRREIVSELTAGIKPAEVEEAPSVANALQTLNQKKIDACFLGPSLAKDTAGQFLAQARVLSKNKHCAYVAILNRNADHANYLIEHGALETVFRPLKTKTFRQIIERAREKALKLPLDQSQPSRLLRDYLERTASELRTVSLAIKEGKLKPVGDNGVSLATRDAIRLSLETALPQDDLGRKAGSFDHHFISCLVEWFIEQTTTNRSEAREEFRKRLLAYHGE